MKTILLAGVLSILLPAAGRAAAGEDAFLRSLRPLELSAPMRKIAARPSNTSFLPERYFKTTTVFTIHFTDNDTGEETLRVGPTPREGFTARFTDGNVKYQFVYVKLYVDETLAIVNMSESIRSTPGADGVFVESGEYQSFTIDPKTKQFARSVASKTLNGVDVGNGVLKYFEPELGADATTLSTRRVGEDGTESNSVATIDMNLDNGDGRSATSMETTYVYEPVKTAEFLKQFPGPVQEFLRKFSDLHWRTFLAGQILGDCYKAGRGDACAALQKTYDEAHQERHEYWTKTIQAADLAPLKPTRRLPQR